MNNKEKVEAMASSMLSIFDSLMLYDSGALILYGETLSQVMWRKMKHYGIDLNKELGFTHLKPHTESIKRVDMDDVRKVIVEALKHGFNSYEENESGLKAFNIDIEANYIIKKYIS